MATNGLEFPEGCVESISLSANLALLRAYPFIGLMPTSMAQSPVQGEGVRMLNFERASFLPTVWVFRRATLRPAAKAVVDCMFDFRESRWRG